MTAAVLSPPMPRTPIAQGYDIFGYRCRVETRSPSARRLLRRLYAPFHSSAAAAAEAGTDSFALEQPAASGGRWRLRHGDAILHAERSLGIILQQLEYELCLRTMAHRPDLVALHGATVFTDGGRGAAIITGQSGAGKTTLALALAARGYRVGGDDIAFFDPRTHQLWPLPRCFHLDDRSWRLVQAAGLRVPADARRHRFLTPAHLGVVALHSAPVRHVLLAARGPELLPWLTPLPLAAVAVELLPQLRWTSASPVTAVETVTPLLQHATGHRLCSGELEATVGLVSSLVGPP